MPSRSFESTMAAAGLDPAPRWLPPAWATITGFLALHLILAAWVPLVEDEAYYALWARHLAWGYYDHPGMIAWWIRLGEALLGHHPLAVRLVSVIAFAASTAMVARLAYLLSGERRRGDLAALYANVIPPVLILGFTATPDAPSVLFWTATLWAMVEALMRTERDTRWWLLAGLCAGLGVQSKFTNLFLGPALILWLVLSRHGRARLGRPVIWGAAAVALAVMAPLVWWNYSHDWVGLSRQFGRIDARHFGLRWIGDYLLTTLVAATPLLAYAAGRGAARLRPAGQLVLWLSAPLILYMFYHATHAKVQPNWLAPLYPSVALLAALHRPRRPDLFAALAAGSALALGALALTLALWPGRAIFPGHNPPNETKGWPPVIAAIEQARTAAGATWIATASYGVTGSLAWYLPKMEVRAVTAPERYLFRPTPSAALCRAPGLLVTRGAPAPSLLSRFGHHGATQFVARKAGGRTLERYGLTPVARPDARAMAICAG